MQDFIDVQGHLQGGQLVALAIDDLHVGDDAHRVGHRHDPPAKIHPVPGNACSTDAQCPAGECGPSLFDFSGRYLAGVGPVVIQPGAYAVESQQPATLEGQTETETLLAFVTPEGLTTTDANGDVDTLDPVLTLRSKTSGSVTPRSGQGRR